MKDLIIVCAGGFGKEVVVLVEKINKIKPELNILGFLDDTKFIGTEVYHGHRVIGGIKEFMPKDGQIFAMGISDPKAKERLYTDLKAKGAEFATLISPQSYIPSETEIGEGTIITTGWIGTNVKMGKCVNIAGSMVGDAIIDDFSTTTGFTNIAGATIGKRVFVGSHAVVLNNKHVGDDAQVCAGAIVMKNVKPGTTVYGNPARELKI